MSLPSAGIRRGTAAEGIAGERPGRCLQQLKGERVGGHDKNQITTNSESKTLKLELTSEV